MLPVRVISLVRSAERRKAFSRRNAHLDFEFVDAVDGCTSSLAGLNAGGLFEPGLRYSAGAYGAALSHLAQWDAIIASGQSRTVAEDDAVFRQDFHQQQERALESLTPGWDIVLWGWNFDSILSVSPMAGMSPMVLLSDQQQLRGALDQFQAVTAPPQLLRLDRCFGLPCYAMSVAGARKFKAACFPVRNFSIRFPLFDQTIPNFGIDIATNRVYSTASAYVSLPPLVATANDRSISTVQNEIYLPGTKR
jgi:GR25 family glycosyltransferase involved in LPS biosynthesis